MSENHETIDQPSERPISLGVIQGETDVVLEHEAVEDSNASDGFKRTVQSGEDPKPFNQRTGLGITK